MSAAVESFRARSLADLLTSGMATYWDRRAAVFEWAAPKASDFTGRASAQDMVDRAIRCHQTSAACRAKAEVLRRYGPPDDVLAEVADVLAEVLP